MPRKTIAATASVIALLGAVVLPSGAAAEYYVPPGNSAVNQYTESFPGAGGETGGGKQKAVPAKTIGAGNAKRLEAEGPVGTAAAEVAAETAPPAHLYVSDSSSDSVGKGSKDSGGGHGNRSNAGSDKTGNSTGAGDGAGTTHVNQPSGSPGLSSVLGQATGAGDGGNIGLWLPLAILATLAGTIAYRVGLRHEHRPTA
jgi:hypothetical protein